MQTHDAAAWQRLGRAVKRARLEAGYRALPDFGVAAGVSSKTLGNLENGRPVGDSTIYAVERALGWHMGRAEELLDEDPVSGGQQDAGYVARRGQDEDAAAGMSDDEVLELVKTARRLADELERRVSGGDPESMGRGQ